ncbi:nucleotidyltransferase domain-containing protein [Actinoplanes sp. NPDC026623]|uniref:nucleotidyltransferase domain-containing protein n=1 Tax=Actinoplanes sp. NPDC026623 TaxID=3155610 RepID=UPI0033C63498
MIPELDDGVSRICATYLALADRHAPGLVEGLYLQGSVALGDYRPGVSDIDFVAVTGRQPPAGTVGAIHADLRRSHRRTSFDGLYVGWDDLRRDPAQAAPGPAVHEWRVQPASRFERNLVTWHVLAQAGVAVRGPAAATLGVFTDWPALAEATRRNLVEYWTPWLRGPASGVVGLTPWATAWGALGVVRLRQTLAAGRVTSKTAAVAYALDTYDRRWHRLVNEAARLRLGGARRYRNPWRRRADLIGFLTEVLRG